MIEFKSLPLEDAILEKYSSISVSRYIGKCIFFFIFYKEDAFFTFREIVMFFHFLIFGSILFLPIY
ncbi:hypothetical protein DQM68_16010 [Leptospira mayottensis]|uniref:Uncharacterized protein n=1 Tax=Leptospira mayottensis TaxID=1137606 RepID=A0ABM7D9J5_9LEPT|nr:hypothetical protein DQM68_16010 [Leptospira mayottensis]AXR65867.1 hypothetical protein DQM28_18345 [Leptospira mayottensis]AZQ01595.1 hypothetical protein LEP1GSC190_05710 [Leptospira mayottensis 200901116]TGN17916.1 hypothetical protein EHR03_00475 [Leptospira mayottensis]